MINPYLALAALGAGYVGFKAALNKYNELRKPSFCGKWKAGDFLNKVETLRVQYSGNKEVLALFDTLEKMCKDLPPDEVITIG